MSEKESREKLLNKYKLSVLYLLDFSPRALSTSQICDVLLEEVFSNFFHLQQALSQLLESGLIQKGGPDRYTYYSITEAGKKALPYLVGDLSLELRRTILAQAKKLKLDTEGFVPEGDWHRMVSGGCQVHLKLMEGSRPLLDLTLQVPGAKAAQRICEGWASKSSEVYELLLEKLMA